MFCPSCGFEYTQKTNYCKRCGEDLNPAVVNDAPKKNATKRGHYVLRGYSFLPGGDGAPFGRL